MAENSAKSSQRKKQDIARRERRDRINKLRKFA